MAAASGRGQGPLRAPPAGTFGTGGVPPGPSVSGDGRPVVLYGSRVALWSFGEHLWTATKQGTLAAKRHWYARLRSSTHRGARPSKRLTAAALGAATATDDGKLSGGGDSTFDLGYETGITGMMTFFNDAGRADGTMVSFDDVVCVYSMTPSKRGGAFLHPHNNYLVWEGGVEAVQADCEKAKEKGKASQYHFRLRAATKEDGKFVLDYANQDPVAVDSPCFLEVMSASGGGSSFVCARDEYLYISKELTNDCLFLVEHGDLRKTMRFRPVRGAGDETPTLETAFAHLPDVVLEMQRYYGKRIGKGHWNAAGREEFAGSEPHFSTEKAEKVDFPPTDAAFAELIKWFSLHHFCDGDGPYVLDWRLMDLGADGEGWMYAQSFKALLETKDPVIMAANAGQRLGPGDEPMGIEFEKNKRVRCRRWVRRDSPEGRRVLGIPEPDKPEPSPSDALSPKKKGKNRKAPTRKTSRAGEKSTTRLPNVGMEDKIDEEGGDEEVDVVTHGVTACHLVQHTDELATTYTSEIWSCPVLAVFRGQGGAQAPDGAGDWTENGVQATISLHADHDAIRIHAASHVDALSAALTTEAGETSWAVQDADAPESSADGASDSVADTLVLKVSGMMRVEPVKSRPKEEVEDADFPDFRRWIALSSQNMSFEDEGSQEVCDATGVVYIRPDDTWEAESLDEHMAIFGKPEEFRTDYDQALKRITDLSFLKAAGDCRTRLLQVAERAVMAPRLEYVALAETQTPEMLAAAHEAAEKLKEANSAHAVSLQVEQYFIKIQNMLAKIVEDRASWGGEFESKVRQLCEETIKEQNEALDHKLKEGQEMLEATTKKLNDSLVKLADIVRKQMLLTLQFASPVVPAGERIGDVLSTKKTGWMYKTPVKALGSATSAMLSSSGVASPGTSLMMSYAAGQMPTGMDDAGEDETKAADAAKGADGQVAEAKAGAADGKDGVVGGADGTEAIEGADPKQVAIDVAAEKKRKEQIAKDFPSLKPPFDMDDHLENHRCLLSVVCCLCVVNLILVVILALVP